MVPGFSLASAIVALMSEAGKLGCAKINNGDDAIENVLRSISFVPKEHCRAIQLADLLAFYSRRDGVAYLRAIEKNDETFTSDTIVKIITERVLHRAFVATGFHDRPPS